MANKTVLQIVTSVCNELNLPAPTVAVSSTNQNEVKILAFVSAVCEDLLAEFDWQELQTRYTFSTASTVSAYPFPADYFRPIDGTFFDTTNRWPLRSLTPTQWEIAQTFALSTSPFERFRVFGGQFHVFPTPSTVNYTFVFDYISSNYVYDPGTNTNISNIKDDSSVILFDSRLVIYGVKLKFLSGIGQDVTRAERDYLNAKALAQGRDVPGQRISLIPRGEHLISTANYPDGNFNQ